MKKIILLLIGLILSVMVSPADYLCTFKLANFEQVSETQFEFDLQLHNKGTQAFGLDAAQTKILLNADMFRGLSPNGARSLTCVSSDLKGDYGGDGVNPPTLAQMMTVTLNNGFLVFVTTELPFVWPKIDVVQPGSYVKLARIKVLFSTGAGPASQWRNQPFAEVEHGVMFDPLAGHHTVTRVNVYDATSEPGVVYKDTEPTSGTPDYSVVPMAAVENLPAQEVLASACFSGIGDHSLASLWNSSTSSTIAGYHQVPSASQRVLIKGNCAVSENWSHSAQLQIARDATLTVKDRLAVPALKVSPNGRLVVEPTKALVVSDAIVNDGTLVIQSSESGTGVYIAPPTTSGAGELEVQQYLTGANDGEVPRGRMWYIAPPLTGATSAVVDAAGMTKLWYYNEPANGYTEITDNATILNSGTGYVVRLATTSTVKFTGTTPVTNAVTIPLSYTSGNSKRGYTLVGNPYTSYLDWTSVETSADVLPTIWIRSFSGRSMGFDTYNRALNLGVSNNGNRVSRYIAPMQAFWVEATAAASITMKPEHRTEKDLVYSDNRLKVKSMPAENLESQKSISMPAENQGSQKTISMPADSLQYVKIKLTGSKGSDETILAFTSEASDAIERLDSKKMRDSEAPIEIFSMVQDIPVAINSMTSRELNKHYPLQVQSREAGELVVTIDDVQLADTQEQVYLYDAARGTELNLNTEGSATIYWEAADESDRLSIIFKTRDQTTDITTSNQADWSVRSIAKGKLRTMGEAGSSAQVSLYSLSGIQLETRELKTPGTITHTLPSGYYIVTIVTDAGKITTQKLNIY